MYSVIPLFLASCLFIHTISFSAAYHSEPPASAEQGFYLVWNDDIAYVIFSYLDFVDQSSVAMVSPQAQGRAKLVIFKLYPRGFTFNAGNVDEHVAFFNRFSLIKAPEFKLNVPIELAAANDEELKKLANLLATTPCISTQSLTIRSIDANANISCQLVPQLATILRSQPNASSITIKRSDYWREPISLECAQIIGNSPNCTSCILEIMSLDAAGLSALAQSTSLTNLSIRDVSTGEGSVALPQNLKVIKVTGPDISKEFFSCVSGLKHLNTVEISSSYNNDSKTIDISSCLVNILALNLTNLTIRGFLTASRDVLKSFAGKSAERAEYCSFKDSNGRSQLKLNLGEKKLEHQSAFTMKLPHSEIDAALDVIRTKLSQQKRINFSIYKHELWLSEITGDVPLSINAETWNDVLADVLKKLDDNIKVSLTLNKADGLVVDDAVLGAILTKQCHNLEIRGDFSFATNAFAVLRVNAPAVHISLTNSNIYGQQFILHRKKQEELKYGQYSNAFLSAEKGQKPIAREVVLAIASIPKVNNIHIEGLHDLSATDILSLSQNGFDELNISPENAKSLGQRLKNFKTIDIQIDNGPHGPMLAFTRYRRNRGVDKTPMVIVSGKNQDWKSVDVIESVCSIDGLKTLRLNGTTLSLPMAQALKHCTSLDTLSISDLDHQIAAADLPSFNVIELKAWNQDIAKALSNVAGLKEIRVHIEDGGDSSGFLSWARTQKLNTAALMSVSGDNESGFFMNVILVGKIPQEYKHSFGQGIGFGTATPEGDNVPEFIKPKESCELAFINSDITDDELVKLQNQPGLIKLDLSGSLGISIKGLKAVMNNPSLKEIILSKAFVIQAHALHEKFRNVTIKFAD